jgi:hypothetical protein
MRDRADEANLLHPDPYARFCVSVVGSVLRSTAETVRKPNRWLVGSSAGWCRSMVRPFLLVYDPFLTMLIPPCYPRRSSQLGLPDFGSSLSFPFPFAFSHVLIPALYRLLPLSLLTPDHLLPDRIPLLFSLLTSGVFYLNQSLPFGGCKASGYGRFGGPEGLRALCNIKAVVRDRFFSVIQTSIPPPVGTSSLLLSNLSSIVLFGA